MIESKYRLNDWIYIDVDGTIQHCVDLIKRKREEGFKIVVWSANGQAHAQRIVNHLGLHVDYVLSKPGYIIDDCGIKWLNFVRIILPKNLGKIFQP